MLRSEAETRVERFVLDTGNVAYNDTEVTNALKSAQRGVWKIAAASTPMMFALAVSKTSSAVGVVSLTSEDPIKIIDVAELHGDVRYPVAGGSLLDVRTHLRSALNVEVVYIPRCAYPVNAGDAFLWGTSEETDELDELMVLWACAKLLVKEDTVNKALNDEVARLRASIEKQPSSPTFRAFSKSVQPSSSYRWHKLSGDTLQLFCV